MKMICRLLAGAAVALGLHVTANAAEPVTLVVPQLDDPRTLSPDFASDTGAYGPTSNIYSHLVTMDWGVVAGTPAYGDLAKTWDISTDGTTVTFHLFPNVKFHDGVPLTSADVLFTFQRIIAKNYPYAAFLRSVAQMEAPDATTVVFHLAAPDMSLVPMMAQAAGWNGKIYPQHLWEKEAGFDTGPYVNKPIGSGPFRFVRWEAGVVEMDAFPDYFRGKPAIDRLIIRHVADANVARAEFDAGNFPYLPYDFAPPLAEVPALQADPNVRVVFTPSHYSRDIQFNLRRKPFDDPKVRMAIAESIDREAISKLAFNGFWKPAYHANVDTQQFWINNDVSFPPFNRDAAGKAFDEAGLPRKQGGWRFAAKLAGPPYSDCRSINEVLVQQLRQVGIDATLETMDQSTWFQRMQQGNFDISCYFTRYGPDPDAYREHFGTKGPRNFMGYSNAEFDTLAAKADMITDPNQRAPLYKQMQAMLVRDMPYVNLFNEQKTSLERPGWSGFSTEPDGYNTSVSWFGFYGVRPPKH